MLNLTLPLVLGTALVDSINPCAFSVLLITMGFLFSLGHDRNKILKTGGLYIFGIFTSYILIGLGLLKAFSVLGVPHFMSKVGAIILILAGALDVINYLFPSFPIKLKIPSSAHSKIAYLMEKSSSQAAFALGILIGIYEFPCTGGPYLMILGLLHDKASFISGMVYLIIYNIIFVAPLVLVLLFGSKRAFLSKLEEWKKTKTNEVKLASGIIMILLAILILAL